MSTFQCRLSDKADKTFTYNDAIDLSKRLLNYRMGVLLQCPLTTEARSLRSREIQCENVNNYHCLKSVVDDRPRELCTSPIWIEIGIVHLTLTAVYW